MPNADPSVHGCERRDRLHRSRRLLGAVVALTLVAAVAACQPSAPIEPGDPGAADVTLNVRSDQGLHSVSPLIYGINDTAGQAFTGQTLSRLGGNRWTAYNWENNASNAGSDYCFQNDGYLSSSSVPGAPVHDALTQAEATHTAKVVTVPIVDYVAADKLGGCDVRNSPDYLNTRMRRNQAVGPVTTTPDVSDANVFQNQFVTWLRQAHPNANVLFSLDNEPDLWSSTHAEVHPAPVTYAELANRTLTFARALKDVAPQAPVLGPVSYGWYGYTTLQGAPDSGANGDFLNWWLDRMRAADTAGGRRLVDYMDLHWYPEAMGGGRRITDADANSPGTVDARVQAPRSLWDPTHTEDSWITRDGGSGPIRLIGRMHDKIAAHYPGTKLAVTEWNYGGGSQSAGGAHVSGAVATADALGVFGREGLDLAAYWPLAAHEEFNLAAFKAFRNYDGAGAAFGDTAEQATSSDNTAVTVYASHDAARPNRVVIVTINKSTVAKTAAVRVADPQSFSRAKVYRVAAPTADVVAAPDLTASATNAFRTTLPPMSVTVLVPQA